METKLEKEIILKNIWIVGMERKHFDITISNGRFSSVVESVSTNQQDRTVKELWISPGIMDLHTHLAWTDFDYEDQRKRDKKEIEVLQVQAFEAARRIGVTTVRDAGGLLPSAAQYICQQYHQELRVLACGAMLGSQDAKGSNFLVNKVKEITKTDCRWIKIFATGGLGSPSEKVLDPIFSKEEFISIVNQAHVMNIKVMVHTWGGPTLDWSIDAGVDSVEHGVYLTKNQADRLALSGIPFIPTTAIYRIAADPSGVLALPTLLCDRAARAAEAQIHAVHYAKQAGVKFGFGTDFATPALYGKNLEELYVLMDCGLTREEAWSSATESAAKILGYETHLGRIAEGYTADAILFHSNPYDAPNAATLSESVQSVITGTTEFE